MGPGSRGGSPEISRSCHTARSGSLASSRMIDRVGGERLLFGDGVGRSVGNGFGPCIRRRDVSLFRPGGPGRP